MATSGLLLVVCTGNICRSPYLHRRLALGLVGTGVRVSSAGTGALVDHPMDVTMAGHLGADADTAFLARRLERAEVLAADLVLTATREHRAVVTRMAPRALRTTFAAGDFAHLADALDDDAVAALAGGSLADRVSAVAAQRPRLTPLPAHEADIADPYRRSAEEYAAAAAHIDRLVPSIVRVLR